MIVSGEGELEALRFRLAVYLLKLPQDGWLALGRALNSLEAELDSLVLVATVAEIARETNLPSARRFFADLINSHRSGLRCIAAAELGAASGGWARELLELRLRQEQNATVKAVIKAGLKKGKG